MVTRPPFCAQASEWFDVRALGERVHLIGEPGHVNSFLIEGEQSAVLFDSGMGIAPVSEVVRMLTDLPVTVVASHHHIDHRGGHADLASADVEIVDFAAHPAAIDPSSGCAHADADPAFLRSYVSAMTDVVGRYRDYRESDDQFFFALARSSPMRPLPDLRDWRIPAVEPTRLLGDGERLDLGGRSLTVLHTPGHSPDALCLFEEATGMLFSGDTVIAAAHWLHGAGADVGAFARSTDRLCALPVSRVFVAHNLIAELPPNAVGEVAAAAAALLTADTVSRPGTDMLGHPVTRHQCGAVTLLTPSQE